MFKLRATIQCHSMDVRAVSAYPENGFVTASRDKLAKVHLPQKGSVGFIEAQAFRGPEHYASSVCVAIDEITHKPLVFVGSNDAIIYVFDIDSSEAKFQLVGHSGVVCSLSPLSGKPIVVSGSWDHTARIWKEFNCVHTFSGHTETVWAAAFIGDHVITASADKTLKLWDPKDEKHCRVTYAKHKDSVRGIAVISEREFLSCSNDATVMHWRVSGELLRTFDGHENFIYSVAMLSPSEFITCSEDRTVRIWNEGNIVQTIRLPATTLWSVSAIDNASIVVGASNGKVYVFSRDPKLQAPMQDQKILEEEVAKSAVPITELGDIKVNQLPEKEALMVPGKREGQTKLIREGTSVKVFQWNSLKQEWIPVGDVVGAANTGKDPSQKVTYEGKDYDYVFDVDIKDGEPPLKLPYNINSDPWHTAQEFIHKHDLSQVYLDQVANFIIKNTQGAMIGSMDTTPYDPFTGDSRYVPQSGIQSQVSKPVETEYFPQKSYLFFETANIEGMAKKLQEFSDKVPNNVKINSKDVNLLLQLADVTLEVQHEQITLIKMLLSWPKAYIFPALDLLRLAVLIPRVNEELCASKDSARLMDTLLICATDESSAPNQMLALRTLCNLFSHRVGQSLIVSYAATISKALSMCLKFVGKNAQTALATFIMNCAVLACQESLRDLKMECISFVAAALKRPLEPEAQFRFLVALGTILGTDSELRNLTKSAELYSLIETYVKNKNPPKVGNCAEKIRLLLK